MARDVEVNVTASDKTGPGLASAERRFKQTSKNVETEADRLSFSVGKGMASVIEGFAPGLSKSISGAIGSAGPVGGVALAAGIAASAPLIGATVSAAVLGAAGLGGVVGGLVLASKDARVQAATNTIGDRIEARLYKAGGSFVEPAIDGVEEIGRAVDTIDLEGIFEDASRYVAPLARGISSAMEDLGDGIESLVANAGPVIDTIGEGIAEIGEAIGDGLESLADNGASAADALEIVFGIITTSIDSVFLVVNALTELYEIGQKIGADLGLRLVLRAMGVDLDALADSSDDAAEATTDASGGIQRVGEAAKRTEDPMETFIEQLEDSVEAAQSLYDSETSVAAAIDKAREAAEENGRTLDENTERGRDNRDALSDLATSLRENYEKYVELNGASGEANEIAEENRRAFIKAARQFGLTGDEAEALADSILGIPKTANTKANLNDTQAEKDAKAYIAMLRKIPSHKLTVLEIARVVTGSSAGDSAIDSALRKQNGKASGGPVQPGESYLVGENGPEILQMGNRGGSIVPNHALGGAGADGTLYAEIDLGEGIRQVVEIQLRGHDRTLKRRAMAGAR